MAMVDMTMSAEEAKEQTAPDTSDAPKYPWGLRISLDDDSIEKLGLTTLPAVGSKMTMTCAVEVCSTGAYQDQSGESETSMSLQITAMELAPAQDAQTQTSAATALYGS